MDLKDKVVVITGAASGIGRSTAEVFIRAGASVVGLDIKIPAESLKGARFLEVNVANSNDVEKCFQNILETEGHIDCLVNNAGISKDAPVWKMTESMWDDVIDVNLKGAFNCIHHVAPHFREQQSGKIVNVASINGMRGKFGLANYAASKAGIIGLTKAVATELARYRVNVNAVAPGLIATPLVMSMTPEALAKSKSEILLGEPGQPEDVANTVVFLCSDLAKHITGEIIKIDGGQYI
ncbi:SDR family oxidoreductase [bacterium]|nr:MAG: SDR family oxidoreductase [bacterium]